MLPAKFLLTILLLISASSPCDRACAEELSQDDLDEMFVELTDMSEQEREKAIHKLCRMYDKRTMKGMADLLLMHKERSATGTEALLEEGDDQGQKVVLRDDIKEEIVGALCLIADDSLVPKLKEMVGSGNEAIAGQGIRIAGFVGSPDSVALLRKVASSGKPKLKVAAIRSLGDSDSGEVIAYLQELFQKSAGAERSAARQALAGLGVRAGVRGSEEVRKRMEARRRVACIGPAGCGAWLSWTRHHLPAVEFNEGVAEEAFAKALSESGMLYMAPNAGSIKGAADALFRNPAIQKAITTFLQEGGVLFVDAGPVSAGTVDYLKSVGVTPPGAPVNDRCEAVRSEEDAHPITEEPEPMDRTWGQLDCAAAWTAWPSGFTAPYRSSMNPSRAVLLLQEGVLAGGDVIFNQIDSLTQRSEKSARMLYNVLTWYFGVVRISPRYFKMSDTVKTPHVRWAKPYHLGETKLVFALDGYGDRLPLEIAQRLESSFDFVPWIQEGGFYPTGNLEHDVVHRLKQALRKKPDVLVVGVYEDLNWRLVPDLVKKDIEKEVGRRGMGLIILTSSKSVDLADVLEGQEVYRPPFLERASPFKFSRLNFQGVDMGRGRILLVDTGIHKDNFYSAAVQSAFVFPKEFLRPGVWADWSPRGPSEYLYLWLTKAILWACHKEPSTDICELAPGKATFDVSEKPFLRVRLASKNKEAKKLRLEVSVVDTYDQVLAQAGSEADVQVGDTEHVVPLPELQEGHHLLNVVARDPEGRAVTFGAVPLVVVSEARIQGIRPERRFYEAPAEVSGSVVLSAKPPNAQLSLKAFDTYDRLIHEQELPPGQAEAKFAFPLKHAVSRLVLLRAELKSGGRTVSFIEKSIPIHLPLERDYCWYLWGSKHAAARVFQGLGVDYVMAHAIGYSEAYLSENWETALRANLGLFGFGIDDMKSGCQTSIIHAARLRETVEGRTRVLTELGGARDFLLGDEQELGDTQCTEPSCLYLFRRQLRETYGSLDKLNETWQTSFKDWEDVTPMKQGEVLERPSFAPFVDHAGFMDSTFSDRVADAQRLLREFEPQGRVGYSGTQELNVPGYDWWKLMKHMAFLCRYGGVQDELARSFARPDLAMGQWCAGYELSDTQEETTRWQVWSQFLHGCNFLAYYYGGGANLLGPDWTPNNVPTWVSEEVRELKSGLAKLLMHCAWWHEGIAIHYSQPSIHVARVTTKVRAMPAPYRGVIPSIPAFMQLVEGLGLQYNFVSYEQVEKGALLDGGYRVFLMPMSEAISELEAREIGRFVADGGTVIADYGPGVRDNHGAPAKSDLLKDVFGLSFKPGKEKAATLPVVGSDELQSALKPDSLALHIPSEVQPVSAKPLGRIGEAPALFLNSHGKGKAIYLNFVPGAVHRELLARLLAMAGVQPRVRLRSEGGEPPDAELFYYRNEKTEYLGLMPGRNVPPKVTIGLPSACHVYDVRKRKYLGQVSEMETQILPRRAEVFALMPYRIEAVAVEAAGAARPGEVVDYECRVKASEGAPGLHVLRVEVFGPDNVPHPEYGRNLLARDGAGKGEVPLALNEKKGNWRIIVTDVVSGQSAERVLDVQ